MDGKIEHDGVIDSVVGNHVSVRIVQQAACSGCKARSMCSQSESKEKFIDVYEADAESRRKVGDEVRVCGALSMGKQAVRLAFGVPLALIVVLMPVMLRVMNWGELTSVGVLAAVLAAYFFVLYLNRGKMAKRFAFWIEE